MAPSDLEKTARRNVRAFTLFRMFFSARFYYPIYALLFLDYGLTLEQFGVMSVCWAATIVLLEVPAGALAEALGRSKLLVATGILMVLEMAVLRGTHNIFLRSYSIVSNASARDCRLWPSLQTARP